MTELSAERARVQGEQGAALRDVDGRTYAGASVALSTLTLTALEVCVAMAVSSAARGVEAVVVHGGEVSAGDQALIREFGGAGVPIHLIGSSVSPYTIFA